MHLFSGFQLSLPETVLFFFFVSLPFIMLFLGVLLIVTLIVKTIRNRGSTHYSKSPLKNTVLLLAGLVLAFVLSGVTSSFGLLLVLLLLFLVFILSPQALRRSVMFLILGYVLSSALNLFMRY